MILDQISYLFRAAMPIVAVSSPSSDEVTTVRYLLESLSQKPLFTEYFSWDIAIGLQKLSLTDGGIQSQVVTDNILQPLEMLEHISKPSNGSRLFILLDFQHFLTPDNLATQRAMKNLALKLKQSKDRVIVLGQNIKLPDDFSGLICEFNNPLPSPQRVKDCLEVNFSQLKKLKKPELPVNLNESELQKLIRAAQGLTQEEIGDAIRLAAVTCGRLDGKTTFDIVQSAKVGKLKKLGVIFSDPPSTSVGGLEQLMDWIQKRTKLFAAQGVVDNIPTVKGILLVGPPGTGKSHVAKTIASHWGIPNLSLDIGSLYGGIVGESESNTRHLIQMLNLSAPCVLLLDEIDKAFASVSGPSGDSGVTQRMFGTLLTWMNDKKTPVFIVATANQVSGLPPELLRKGRFNEIFYIDFPNKVERSQILSIHLAYRKALLTVDEISQISDQTEGFSGAELADIVEEASVEAYCNLDDASQISFPSLIELAQNTTPQSVSRKSDFDALREWGTSHARQASLSIPNEQVQQSGYHINLN
jgi:SpoVK/Ycf46/Vps4 family AAA+-type ATPase